MQTTNNSDLVTRARMVDAGRPPGGLFADHSWRLDGRAFPLPSRLVGELDGLGRVLLQFYRAAGLLHRQSSTGRQPEWIASLLDQGKPADLLAHQSHPTFRSELPRVIRPDLLLTEEGIAITELDSVPGGIGLTAWLNRMYSQWDNDLIGGASGMLEGFEGIFGDASNVHLVVSEESATYRPEMEWIASQLNTRTYAVRSQDFNGFSDGDAVYRFFELFDLANISGAEQLIELAKQGKVRLTPPPKPVFEEKLLFALLWNRNLKEFWRQHIGDGFLRKLQSLVPYTWVIDPMPLPPHAAYPEINLTDWQQLKQLSQRERDLILKVSGYSEKAWGARGVHLGSDLSQADWSSAVDEAIQAFPKSPYILQRYHKPRTVDASWVDLDAGQVVPMKGRVRLCPYYFVHGDGDQARTKLGGILATICPADKKIIHGMTDAILAPCTVAPEQ